MSADFKIPHPPAGFVYDREMEDWDGPKAYIPGDKLGALSAWEPKAGVIVTLDAPEKPYTLEEIRQFHKALGNLLEAIETDDAK